MSGTAGAAAADGGFAEEYGSRHGYAPAAADPGPAPHEGPGDRHTYESGEGGWADTCRQSPSERSPASRTTGHPGGAG